ncbi:MAG: 30S ribosomal protein S16 [Patescibacteria group bacterium]
MLMIRLKRVGRTNDPSFRIVVGEKIYSPKSGKHFAYLGSYNPKTKATIIDKEAVKEWIGKGAQLSDTVHNLFLNNKIIEGKKINVLPAFKAAPVEEKPAEAVASAPAVEESPAEVAEAPAEEPAKAE